MAYTTVDDVKLKIGIPASDTSQDTRIQYYIDGTKDLIDFYLGGDYQQGSKEHDVCTCEVVSGCSCQWQFRLPVSEVTSVDTINGVAYTGVLGEDYKITGYRKDTILINDFKETLTDLDFSCFTVEYTAGYNPIPNGLNYAHACIVEGQMAQLGGQTVTRETLGPRTVVFANNADANSFKSQINLYAPVCV